MGCKKCMFRAVINLLGPNVHCRTGGCTFKQHLPASPRLAVQLRNMHPAMTHAALRDIFIEGCMIYMILNKYMIITDAERGIDPRRMLIDLDLISKGA